MYTCQPYLTGEEETHSVPLPGAADADVDPNVNNKASSYTAEDS